MPQENVETVRLMIAAFVEDDYERLVELFDPQIEYDVSRTSPDSRVAHGHEELAEVIEVVARHVGRPPVGASRADRCRR